MIPLVAALLLSGCGDSPEARLDRAAKAFTQNDYRAAQVDLGAVLQEQPGNQRALELAVRAHLAQGDGIAAQAALDKLSRKPADFALLTGEAALLRGKADLALKAVEGLSSAEALRIRALGQLMNGDAGAAAKSFVAGEPAPGDKARLLADHAVFRLGLGHEPEAAVLAERAVKADPKALDPMLASAKVAVATGDLARALKFYDRAAQAFPGNLAALTGKAAVLGDLGRTKELAPLLASLGEQAGGTPAVAYLQAREATGRKDWKKARDILQPIEGQLAGRDDAMLLFAQAQLRLGQAGDARTRLGPLARRAPGHGLTALLLAEAQLTQGDPKAAVATLKPFAAKPEANREVLALIAKAAQAAGDPAAASYADRARYPTPQSLAADIAKGDAALRKKDWEGAAAAYQRILAATDGRNPLVLNNLAYAESMRGNKDRALGYASRALKLAPGNPSVMDTVGWLLVETGGDRSRALDLLGEAARKAPDNATIRTHLAEAKARG